MSGSKRRTRKPANSKNQKSVQKRDRRGKYPKPPSGTPAGFKLHRWRVQKQNYPIMHSPCCSYSYTSSSPFSSFLQHKNKYHRHGSYQTNSCESSQEGRTQQASLQGSAQVSTSCQLIGKEAAPIPKGYRCASQYQEAAEVDRSDAAQTPLPTGGKGIVAEVQRRSAFSEGCRDHPARVRRGLHDPFAGGVATLHVPRQASHRATHRHGAGQAHPRRASLDSAELELQQLKNLLFVFTKLA